MELERRLNIFSRYVTLLAYFLVAYTGDSSAKPLAARVCASCHQKQWDSWIKSKHRVALSSLPFSKRRNLKCRTCHDDAGIRLLIKKQFESSVGKNKSDQQRHITGVDCLSCHGLESNRLNYKPTKNDHHKESVLFENVCDRCHSLPPMNSLKEKCFTPHSLQKKKKSFCNKVDMKHKSHILFPVGKQRDQNLKN